MLNVYQSNTIFRNVLNLNMVLICLSFPSEQSKVGGSASGGNFEDVLSSAAKASAQNEIPSASANNLSENKEC